MQTQIQIKLRPSEAADSNDLLKAISQITGQPKEAIKGFHILKKFKYQGLY